MDDVETRHKFYEAVLHRNEIEAVLDGVALPCIALRSTPLDPGSPHLELTLRSVGAPERVELVRLGALSSLEQVRRYLQRRRDEAERDAANPCFTSGMRNEARRVTNLLDGVLSLWRLNIKPEPWTPLSQSEGDRAVALGALAVAAQSDDDEVKVSVDDLRVALSMIDRLDPEPLLDDDKLDEALGAAHRAGFDTDDGRWDRTSACAEFRRVIQGAEPTRTAPKATVALPTSELLAQTIRRVSETVARQLGTLSMFKPEDPVEVTVVRQALDDIRLALGDLIPVWTGSDEIAEGSEALKREMYESLERVLPFGVARNAMLTIGPLVDRALRDLAEKIDGEHAEDVVDLVRGILRARRRR